LGLLLEILLARLVIVDTTTSLGLAAIVGLAGVAGLLLNPIFNLWLGLALVSTPQPTTAV
jgi:hypothetical protein